MLELNEVYCGNAIELMAQMEDECVDITLTSPPYNVGLEYDIYDDNIDEADFKDFNYKWLEACFRVTRDSGRLYAVLSDKMIWWIKPMAESIGWKFVQPLIWCKPNLAGGNRIGYDWNNISEFILLFRKGKRNSMVNSSYATTHNWFVETSPQTNFKDFNKKQHVAQFPLGLCLKILSRTPGNVVLDPFAGSGMTLVAAKYLGKDYIGFDISPEYVALCKDNLNTQFDFERAFTYKSKYYQTNER